MDISKEYKKAKEEALQKHLIEMTAVLEDPFLNMLRLHTVAIACNCECLGMNAENAIAVCGNCTPPYGEDAYDSVMQKWGLMNEKGEPII